MMQAAAAATDIHEAGAADAGDWEAYVEAHPEGSFFHRYGWRRVLAEGAGFDTVFLAARRQGRIVGVLPLAHTRSWLFGNALVSLPFCVRSGVLADDPEARAALIAHACARADATAVDHLELRHLTPQAPELPCKAETYVNFSRALAPTVEDNLKAIPRKQRAVVRKGIADGLFSREDDDLSDFYRIYATSVRNLGTPVFPRRYFQALKDTFGARVSITTVGHQGRALSSVLSFIDRNTVMPYYGGGLPAARTWRAYDFMYWEVMRKACEAGLGHFDYGRSKPGTGAYAFKKNWGFEPVPLHYEYHLVKRRTLPDLNPANPRYARAVALWKKLPLGLATVIGSRISPWLA